MKKKVSNCVFFERGSWYHRTKTIGEDFQIKYKKSGGFLTEEDALQHYEQCQKQYEQQLTRYRQDASSEILFKDYLLYWYQDVFQLRACSITQMVYAYILYDVLLPITDMNPSISMITTSFINSLLEKVSGYSESAGEKTRELLNMAFKDAVQDEYIQKNPVSSAIRFRRKRKKINVLTKSQIGKLLEAASRYDNLYPELLLALFCGLRKGEILGLKFEDINFQDKTVHIQRQITGDCTVTIDNSNRVKTSFTQSEKAPKTFSSNRVLRVPAIIFPELQHRMEAIEQNKKRYSDKYSIDNSGFVCVNKYGIVKCESALNLALNRACKRNFLPHVSIHDLRHIYATILLEQKTPLAKVSALLGHSSVHTTFEIYCDVMEGSEQITNFVESVFDPSK